jgi:hypothetical protein
VSSHKDTQQEFATTSGGYRLATSVGGTLTGRGGNFIIVDDPLKPQQAYSTLARSSVTQWYNNTLLSRLDNKAEDAIVIVMQRLHVDDFIAHLLGQQGWTHINLPAIAEMDHRIQVGRRRYHDRKAGDVLHAQREPLSVLKQLKQAWGQRISRRNTSKDPCPRVAT